MMVTIQSHIDEDQDSLALIRARYPCFRHFRYPSPPRPFQRAFPSQRRLTHLTITDIHIVGVLSEYGAYGWISAVFLPKHALNA